jgi:hypothetical protein
MSLHPRRRRDISPNRAVALPSGTESSQIHRRRELDSNYQFRDDRKKI